MDAKQRAAALCAEAQTVEELRAAVEMLCAEAHGLKQSLNMVPMADTYDTVSVEVEGVTFLSEYDDRGEGVRVCVEGKAGLVDLGFLLSKEALQDIDKAAHRELRRNQRLREAA